MARPEISIPAGLATVTIVYTIYNRGMPSSADERVSEPGDATLETVRKQNAWMAAAAVGGISLIAKDPTIFVFGGLSVVALDWMARYNIWSNPVTNTISDVTSAFNMGQQENEAEGNNVTSLYDTGVVA